MNFGIIPETLLERVALAMGFVPVPAIDLMFGSLKVRVIMAGVSLGVFEALRGGERTAIELAASLRLDPDALESLLRALAHAKYLEQCGHAYRLSTLAQRTMLTGAPMDLTGFARWHETQWRFVEELEALVRTGQGVDFHQTMRATDAWAHYQRAMFETARFDATTLARIVPVPRGSTRLLDLGGAHGLLGAAICRTHPPMRSTVIDLPEAVEHGRSLAREAGHIDIVDYRAADLLVDPLEAADVALLSNILHHFKPAEMAGVLSRVRDVLRDHGTLAVWEFEAPRRGSKVSHGDVVGLYFRLTSTSQVYHGTEYEAVLRDAGFSAIRTVRPRRSPGRVLLLAEA